MPEFREKNHKKKGGFFLFLFCAAAAYFGSGFLINEVSHRAVPEVIESAARSGIKISSLHFKNPGLAFPVSLKWEDFSAEAHSRRGMFTFKADRLTLSLVRLVSGQITLKGSGVIFSHLPPESAESFSAGERVFQGDVRYSFKINFFPIRRFRENFRSVIADISELVREGSSKADFECRGTLYFSIKEQRFEAELYTVREEEGGRLMMSEESIRRVTARFEEEITPAEISLMAENPVRVLRLYEIKQYAVNKSEEAAKRDSAVPQDAYKHVLWSYLLTKEYGRDFAKKVTDAHEIGSLKNTPADHAMDYQNNLVGQRYAQVGVAERDILGRMLQDPAIIREPEQVFRKA